MTDAVVGCAVGLEDLVTEELSELGYADESISKLRQKGVIGGNYSSGSPD